MTTASTPRGSTEPKSGRTNPRMALINVDLPDPFGPMTPTNWPGGIDNVTDELQNDLGDRTTDFNWGPLAGRSWRLGRGPVLAR